MAYSEFTSLKQVQKELGIINKDISLFTLPTPTFAISQRLIDDMQYAKMMPLMSEKAKSELVITPILKEVKLAKPEFNYFSGYTFDVNTKLALTGVCDFLFTHNNSKNNIAAPVICLVEAKNRTVDEGFGQCAAEMYAAKLYNEQEGENIDVIYGCVTNAYDWCFMKLENNVVYVDIDRYYLNRVDEIVGIMLHILGQYEK